MYNDPFIQQFLSGLGGRAVSPLGPGAPMAGSGAGFGMLPPPPSAPMAQPSVGAGMGPPGGGPSIAPSGSQNSNPGNPFSGMSPDMASSMLQKLMSVNDPTQPPAGTQVKITPQVDPHFVAPAGSGLIQQILAHLGLAGGV